MGAAGAWETAATHFEGAGAPAAGKLIAAKVTSKESMRFVSAAMSVCILKARQEVNEGM
jgi:hypothetical protein